MAALDALGVPETVQPPLSVTARCTDARTRRAPLRLADEVGAGTTPAVEQTWGAAAQPLNHRRARRGRSGFGTTTRGRKTARDGISEGHVFTLRAGAGCVTQLSYRRRGAVAGVGLFTEEPLPARKLLGVFTGENISKREAAARHAARAKCIIAFTDWQRLLAGRLKGPQVPFRPSQQQPGLELAAQRGVCHVGGSAHGGDCARSEGWDGAFG